MKLLRGALVAIVWIPLLATAQISQMEYFFDDDPGYGAGTSITVLQDTSVQLNGEVLDASGLSLGFHTLFVRAYSLTNVYEYVVDSAVFDTDTLATWGPAESRLVFIDQDGAVTINISGLEYFFDEDPGYGNGTMIAVGPSNTISLTNEILDASGLTLGFHNLFIRAQTDGGTWGQTENRLVFIDQDGAVTINISGLEYFFDEDPGYGNGTMIAVGPSNTISLTDEVLDASGLTLGFHTLFMRAQTEGGSWGPFESRLVFVDQSGAVVSNIDQLEYFFDNDPGYGNGIPVMVTPALQINLNDSLDGTGLLIGFHNLYLRARDESGQWGSSESRLVFVDQSGSVMSPIDELEYYIDVDPGYGSATSIPISPPTFDLFRSFAAATAALSEGSHTLSIRGKNQNGQWGLPETLSFVTYNEGRQLDSATLRLMYNQLGGATWSTTTNWLTGSLDTWFGVTLVNSRVDSLALPSNNLQGKLPFQTSYLTQLKKLDLSQNQLNDTIPLQMQNLSNLQGLYLYNNDFDELPDLSGIATLTTAALDSNFFDFGDLEPLVGIPNYSYSNQQLFEEVDSDSIVRIGQPLAIDITVDGAFNVYQWFLNGDTIPNQDLQDYILSEFSAADTGTYQLKIQNTQVTGLELSSAFYTAILNDFDQDSLAMVSLYNSTDGANWSNSTGWLSDSLSNWFGVTVQNDRVTDISMDGNNLNGTIPDDFIYADTMLTMVLSTGNLMDTLPAYMADNWNYIQSINVAGNDFTSIPSFNASPALSFLNVSANRLQFGDLEANLGVATFLYAPQDSITTFRDTIVDSDSNLPLEFAVTGANNTYQWYKDDIAIGNATTNPYVLSNVQFADEAKYRLEIQNSLATNLTLTSGELELKISSLLRDSVALRTVYFETGGPEWNGAVNWLDAPILDWDSVTIVNDRVVEVRLMQNSMVGTLPRVIRDITSLEVLNLAQNDLISIPNMSQMPALNTFNIASNQIGFAEIIINLPIEQRGDEFIYNPQNPIGGAVQKKIPVDSSYLFDSGISGVGNEYQWKYKGQNLAGATSETFFLESIEYDSMGVYTVDVTNPLVPDITLSSDDIEVLAIADIQGTVFNGLDPLSSEGYVSLWRIQEGPYDSLDFGPILPSGLFEIDSVVLGDYLIKATPNDTTLLVSYHPTGVVYTEAATIALRENPQVHDITIAGTVDAGVAPGVSGLIEADLSEESSGRVLARRKVKKAGCSLRRRTRSGGGRTEQDEFDLFYFSQSDDEGNFIFYDIQPGTYVVNIDYPGVPVDTTTFVEFEFGPETGLDQIVLAALVTDNGIVIEQTNALGLDPIDNVNVYPNPARDKVQLSYQIGMPLRDLALKVWTLDGRMIHREMLPFAMGNCSHELDVSSWRPGIYYLIIQNSARDLIVQWKLIVED